MTASVVSWSQFLVGARFDSLRYHIFWEVVGLELSAFSLVSTTEELLGRKSSGSGPDIREYGHGDLLHCSHDTFYLQTLALSSPTSCGRSVGTLRSHKGHGVWSSCCLVLHRCLVCSLNLNTGMEHSSEIPVNFHQTTQYYIPQDSILQSLPWEPQT
jgi:hypothetical protein